MTKPFGQIVAIDDGPRDVSPLKSTHHVALGVHVRPPSSSDAGHGGAASPTHRWQTLVDNGQIHTTATNILTPISAENLRHAHELVESGRTLGKVVLDGWE